MNKKVKHLTEEEITNICESREECKGCPLSVFVDEDGLVYFCAPEILVLNSNGLIKLADKLEEEINI